MRYGMVLDLKKCIGCYSCLATCKSEHNTPPGVFWARVLEKEEGQYPTVSRIFFPTLCYHCKEPPCRDICPTGATTKAEDGIVTVDYDTCIGCRACMMACPYQNRYYWGKPKDTTYFRQELTPFEKAVLTDWQRATVQKCNFCRERLDKGLDPACVLACPPRARTFGDLDDPNSEISRLIRERHGVQIMPELGTDPSVYYLE